MHAMTHAGCMQLLITDARDARMMAQMIKEHQPALAIGVPTQFMKVLNEEIKGTGILGLAGSAAVPPEIQEQFEKQAGGQLMEAYGLSEMTCASHFNVSALIRLFGGRKAVTMISRALERWPGGVELSRKLLHLMGYKRLGKLFDKTTHMLSKFSAKRPKLRGEERRATIGVPLPDTEIRIVDLDTGAEISVREMIEQGRVGEMLVKGPQRMIGYWPEEGKGFDEEGYIHTGDVVMIDENGYFSIVDRTKDMIIISGMKVYSREVDDILYDHPAVAMAATIGVPDPERPGSERVKVFIQPKPEAKGKVTEQEIIDYLSTKIAKYAVPKSVIFLEEMPLTEVEKVNKKYLREMELKEAGLS
jgi:long-chain acyl-CoA synthetase